MLHSTVKHDLFPSNDDKYGVGQNSGYPLRDYNCRLSFNLQLVW